jgi:hypothetical protein
MKDMADRAIYVDSYKSLNMSTISGLPPVGFWVLNSGHYETTFQMHSRPSWLARWAMRVVFEIAWRDA